MYEGEKIQPSFTEVMQYVVALAESIQNSGINLNQPISEDQRQTVLQVIEESDARLKQGLDQMIGLGMLDKVKNSIGSNYGDKRIGASSLTLLDVYSANTQR